MAMDPTKYAAPALDKGLDILEALANSPRGLTLNELARAVERTVSEIFRMALTLQQRGYVAVDENDRYALTLKMLELSHRQQPLQSLVATALPLMRELAGRAYQSCHLTSYHDGHIIVVAQVDRAHPDDRGADTCRWRTGDRRCATIAADRYGAPECVGHLAEPAHPRCDRYITTGVWHQPTCDRGLDGSLHRTAGPAAEPCCAGCGGTRAGNRLAYL
jgi:hypothetical protein